MKIYKYPLEMKPCQLVKAPIIQTLTVQLQQGTPMLWALVDTDKPDTETIIKTIGTGRYIDEPVGRYLGTIQAGCYVFHYFEDELLKDSV